MAWSACNDMHKIWLSQLPKSIKLEIFRATVEPILLYGSETWTLSMKLEKRLDGTYTRLLMRAQNLSWKRHPSISDIYGDLSVSPHSFDPEECNSQATAIVLNRR